MRLKNIGATIHVAEDKSLQNFNEGVVCLKMRKKLNQIYCLLKNL